jgi:hypothetical protein
MGLTADEKKMLADLTAKAEEPDQDDFEIEIYDTGKGRGARIPFSQGKSWLYNELGIGEPPDAGTAADPDEKTGKGSEGAPAAKGYFGRQATG